MKRRRSLLNLVVMAVIAGTLVVVGLALKPDGRAGEPTGSQVAAATSQPFVVSVSSTTAPKVACDEPITHLTSFDRASLEVADLALVSTSVFVGTIRSISPAEWNTADGAPSEMASATFVRRMAAVEIVSGSNVAPGAIVSVALPGGTIGCDSYRLSGFVDAEVGDTVALFVQPVDADPETVGLGMARVGWPVGSDGRVQTPADGDLLPADFVSLAETR